MKNMILCIIAITTIGGCTTTREIIQTRIDTLTIVTPTEYDTVTVHETAAGYEGATVKYHLRVDTLYKKAYITRKPDTVRVAYIDTVTVIESKDPPVFMDRIRGVLWPLAAVIATLALAYIFIVKRK